MVDIDDEHTKQMHELRGNEKKKSPISKEFRGRTVSEAEVLGWRARSLLMIEQRKMSKKRTTNKPTLYCI